KAREARKTEQARRLAQEAEKIADILNADFQKVRARLQEIRAASSREGAAGAHFGDSGDGGDDLDAWVRGTQQPGAIESAKSSRGSASKTDKPAPQITPVGRRNEEGSNAVDPAGGAGEKKSPRGGFRVDYRNLGKAEERSRYDSA